VHNVTSHNQRGCTLHSKLQARAFHTSPLQSLPSSPFDPKKVRTENSSSTRKRPRKQFIPRKAAVLLTAKARSFFLALLKDPPRPEICGIMLHYKQSSSGQPRMVFSFDYCTRDQITSEDEGVTLRVDKDSLPLSPAETWEDGERKLYISHDAFLKVLGSTVDVDVDTLQPILHDGEGNVMDPNA
jgi:hypothetical protein